MKKAKMITIATAAILMCVVVLQNTETVHPQLLLWSFPMPRAALLLVTLLVGFALGVLTTTLTARKR